MQEITEKHRAEKKQLIASIQALKNSINRNDKKRKKEINNEIAKMEADLQAKHLSELKALEESSNVDTSTKASTDGNDDVGDLKKRSESLSLGDSCEDGDDLSDATTPAFKYQIRQLSKAQKKREKKKEAAKVKASQYEDVSDLNRQREEEVSKLTDILSNQRLTIHEIPSDGDCLYNSIVHQLSLAGVQFTVSQLRQRAAEYIKSHKDQFSAFLIDEVTGDLMSHDQIDCYCEKIARTNVWGGQIELQALSESLQKPVCVFQADGQAIHFGTSYSKPNINLCYLKHAYTLGEHYNSLIPA